MVGAADRLEEQRQRAQADLFGRFRKRRGRTGDATERIGAEALLEKRAGIVVERRGGAAEAARRLGKPPAQSGRAPPARA